MTSLDRLTIASRAFCLAAILGLALVSRDEQAFVSLAIVTTVATTAVYLSLTTPLPVAVIVTVEASVTGLVIALALPGGLIFLPYLGAVTLVAGVAGGVVGVSAVVLAQYLMIALITMAFSGNADRSDLLEALGPWLLTSIGAGLLGAWLRKSRKVAKPSKDEASYESAHRLLTQLRTVARRLSSGLDPVTLAAQVIDSVRSGVAADRICVLVRTDGGVLSPLGYSDEGARDDFTPGHALTNECWAEMEPVVGLADEPHDGYLVALPLRVGSRMIGVVLTSLPAPPSVDELKRLMLELDDHSLRLDTAMVFDEVRSIATAEERRRLAREIHDGVAQDVASLGYLVDELIGTVETQEQRQRLTGLREELSRVVSELRLSIFDLRSEVVPGTTLGSALSDYLHQVSSRSPMTVHLTLDEAPTRLRAETETELLRIAQEAIANARKHSNAENLWVDCRVQPPYARLVVRDDGVGLSEGRSDSYGIRIMKERAQRLDARLEISDGTNREPKFGAVVQVTLGNEPPAPRVNESEPDVDGTRDHHSSTRRRP